MVELNFNVGDEVRLRLSDKELDCTILESPESNLVLVKLESGYNIGIAKENILAYRILKKKKEEEKVIVEVKKKEGLPSIGLIITGGTIAAKLDARTGGVRWLTDVNEFLRFYPEIGEIANVKIIEVPFMIGSESMAPENWIGIAECAKKMLDDDGIKGIVVTHGTDTLGYTGAALSFFLKNLNKPVVLTYSQRSIDRASSDAHLNLQCAARMALSECAEVVLVGHGTLNDDYCYALRGTKVRKMHSSRRDAFKPINCGPIAKVWPDRVEFLESYRKRSSEKTEVDVNYSDKVALIKFYPGQSPDILDYYALKYKGVVIEGAGLGHVAPSEVSHSWIASLKKHIKKGLVVCVAPQTIYGRVDPYVYSSAREMLDAGVIFLEDMLPETALVKLGFVLGHYGWKTIVKEKMLDNMVGELNAHLTI